MSGMLPAKCRLLIEREPAEGSWNMAVDEALLEAVGETELPVLRWYRWREATVSMGYFQKVNELDKRLTGLPVVRRLTGGGALVHEFELTYSLILPAPLVATRPTEEFYDLVHRCCADCLIEAGFPVEARGTNRAFADESFLCFARGDSHDLICAGSKVLGSAQRRRRGHILQHGGLLLTAAKAAPELKGLQDLASGELPEDLDEQVSFRIGRELGVEPVPSTLSGRERQLTEELSSSRYRSTDWTVSRKAL